MEADAALPCSADHFTYLALWFSAMDPYLSLKN
jgi:hypothetical protein